MAIEIISKPPQKYRETCSHCGCEFQYELSDVFKRYGYGQPQVNCPTCGHEIYHRNQSCTRKTVVSW